VAAIHNNELTQLEIAAEISAIQDIKERSKMIDIARNGQNQSLAKDLIKKSKTSAKKKKKGVGRSLTSVPLGRVKNTKIVKLIIEACSQTGVVDKPDKNIDWNDYVQIRDVWQQFIINVDNGGKKE
jgi:hypothetical protein